MAGLSKSRILAHRQCAKRLWLQVHQPELSDLSAAPQRAVDPGHAVGEIACQAYPAGVMLSDDLAEALSQTRTLLGVQPRPTLFEATFQYEGVLTRADLLIPVVGKAWLMREVKSSTSVKPYYLEDVAIQTWVMEESGVCLNRLELAHIDNSFVYPGGGDYGGLLKPVDITEEARALVASVPVWVEAARETAGLVSAPDIKPGKQCFDPYECPFSGHCMPAATEDYPVESLPAKYARGLDTQLRSEGFGDLREVPLSRMPNEVLVRVWRATKDDRPYHDVEATRALLKHLPYPRYYLDFETLNPGIPIWAGTRPYQQTPFQWSCHLQNSPGTLNHEAFLAKGDEDPRVAFIESLIDVLGSEGPVFVYSSFEASRLKEVAADFPRFATEVEMIIARIVDLLPIARDHYYHRDQHGSWSLKAVLPTIAPDLRYDDLDVADGGMAMDAFYEVLDSKTTAKRRTQLRQSLLQYCERDTAALVALVRHFEGN